MTDFRLTPSIYCEHLDGECFDFGNCRKCPYKPPEMLPESECKRIAQDAALVIDALQGLVNCSPHIHQNYLKEKLSIVKRCISFIDLFSKG